MEKNPIENLIYHGGYTAIFRRMGFIGDSLSSGEFESKDENGKVDWYDMYEYSWGQFIARKCGLEAFNFSMGGMTAKKFRTENFAQHCGFLDRTKICQAYVIALGVNDMYHIDDDPENYPFGSMDDVDLNDYRNNKASFVGDYCRIIQQIREMQPKARIFVMTMPKEPDFNEEMAKVNKNFDKHAEFLNSLTEIFEFLYVLDLRKYAPIYDDEFKKQFYLAGHLNPMGYMYTADVVCTYIDYIIRNNMDDFKQVGFIGKGVHNTAEKW